jgi:predicted nucleic acid-binding protein
MLVIADTTPLRYLVTLGQDGLLPALFGQILIPPAVADELRHPKAPAAVRTWIAAPPPWLQIRPTSLQPDAALMRLDPGEREALMLAQELRADLVLVDEREARAEAARRAFNAMGTLRVLELAAERNLVDSPSMLTRLQDARFYMTPQMVEALLAHDAARKRPM